MVSDFLTQRFHPSPGTNIFSLPLSMIALPPCTLPHMTKVANLHWFEEVQIET